MSDTDWGTKFARDLFRSMCVEAIKGLSDENKKDLEKIVDEGFGRGRKLDTKLDMLDLSNDNITDNDIQTIVSKLAQSNDPTFTKIDLSDNKITRDGVMVLQQYLTNTENSVTCLDLSGNPLGSLGAQRLLGFVDTAPTIRTLNLDNTDLSDEGAKHVATLISGYPWLKSISLRNNKIGPIGLASIARALVQDTRLETIILDGNIITDAELKTFITTVFKTNATLSHISMKDCFISPLGTADLHIALVLTKNTTLKHFAPTHDDIGLEMHLFGETAVTQKLSASTPSGGRYQDAKGVVRNLADVYYEPRLTTLPPLASAPQSVGSATKDIVTPESVPDESSSDESSSAESDGDE